MRLLRLRLRTALVAVAVVACLLRWAAVRRLECPNCREPATLATLLRNGGCPRCGFSQ
jgi:hypothetical protein